MSRVRGKKAAAGVMNVTVVTCAKCAMEGTGTVTWRRWNRAALVDVVAGTMMNAVGAVTART